MELGAGGNPWNLKDKVQPPSSDIFGASQRPSMSGLEVFAAKVQPYAYVPTKCSL